MKYLVLVVHMLSVVGAQISFEVQEEQQAPVILGNIAAEAGVRSIPGLRFSLSSRKELFDVDELSGDFRTLVVLDRERLCGSVPSCVVTSLVAVSATVDFLHRYVVNVTVVDANDQRPDFGITSFPISLSEGTAVNTSIKLPVAYDGDYEPAFKVQKYYLEPEQHTTFGLIVQRQNKSDGSIDFDLYLRLAQRLDREVLGSYTLTLVASDGDSPGNEARLQIIVTVVDENDNQPMFGQAEYNISIKEITKVGSVVLAVSATDADFGENGRVGYEFPNNIDRKVLDYFEIDNVSGELKLVRSLEKEGGTTFAFKVRASDHGTPVISSEASVKISVEDTVNDPPSISVSHLRSKGNSAVMSEDAVVGTKVAFIDVTDTDSGRNGETSCISTSEYFTMQEYTNPDVYTISLAKFLDREKIPTHIIIIECLDRGTPPLSSAVKLSVIVEDVNDNPPLFTKKFYEMKVKENQEAGEPVGNVFATDADIGINAVLRYSLEPSVTEFEINESNGFIYTALKNLDRETKDRYSFEVYVFDMSLSPLTATTTVTVDIEDLNDEWPRFENSSYRFQVSENAEVNSVIGKVHATDLDLGLGGVVEYHFIYIPAQSDAPFVLSKEDGTITLSQKLNFETKKRYSFLVTAVDLGKPPRNSSVEVQIEIVDENDNDPVITFPNPENFSVTLNLDVAPGQEIIKVVAHDSDSGESGRLTYSLNALNNSAAKLFWMNEDTGQLKLIAPLTQADVRSYNIVISVNDNGVPQRATHARLNIEVIPQANEKRSKESYTTVVIIMVCVTLLVAVVVLVTLCFIKYIDKRKFDSERNVHKTAFEPINKTSENYFHAGCGDDDFEQGAVSSPSIQKQPLSYQNQRIGTNGRNGKKMVTFDSAIRSSDASTMSESVSTQPDSGFNSAGSSYSSPHNSSASANYAHSLPSSGKPGSLDSFSTSSSYKCVPSPASSTSTVTGAAVPVGYSSNISRTVSGSTLLDSGASVSPAASRGQFEAAMAGGDEVVDVALQNHNALVRSLRDNSRRPPYASRQVSSTL